MITAFKAFSLLTSALFLLASYRSSGSIQESSVSPNEERRSSILFFVLLFFLTAFQIYCDRYFFGNFFTKDEFGFARAYAVSIGNGEAVYGGFSQGIAGVFFALWYKVVGHSVFDSRVLSSLISISGALLTFFLVKKEFGAKTAIAAALILRLSSYFILFSSVALEVCFSFLCIPAALYLASISLGNGSRPILAGVILGFTIFTYPGVPLIYFCFALAALTLNPKNTLNWLSKRLPFLIGAILSINIGLLLNHFLYAPSAGSNNLLTGSGKAIWSIPELVESFRANLLDTFIGGTSFYAEYISHSTFIEMVLWGPFIWGCYALSSNRNKKYRIVLLSLLILFFVNLLITRLPGMRRISGTLPLVATVCAIGLVSGGGRWKRYFQIIVGLTLLVNAVLLVPANLAASHVQYESLPPPFPDAEMEKYLHLGNVWIDPAEIWLEAYRVAILAQRELISDQYGAKIGRVYFDRQVAPADACLIYFTWNVIGEASKSMLGEFNVMRIRSPSIPAFSVVSLLDNPYRKQYCTFPAAKNSQSGNVATPSKLIAGHR